MNKMKYNYYEAVKNDAMEYIKENNLEGKTQEELYDELFLADSVTGNASGSYYCNAWKAEEALAHNTDLLIEALNEFGYLDGIDGMNSALRSLHAHGAEWCDVIVRCYVLCKIDLKRLGE